MRIIVIGAGGHARSVCDVLLAQGEHEIAGLLDPSASDGFLGIPVLGDDSLLEALIRNKEVQGAFIAVGSNSIRKKLTLQAESLGYDIVSAISPYAAISKYAKIGKGSVVMPGAIVNVNSVIGEGCILNTNCSIDHDNTIGSYCHIAPGCAICGTVTIGEGTFIGAGARVIDKINIGSNAMLGSGAVAIRDIPPNCTAVGVPAKVIKQGNDKV